MALEIFYMKVLSRPRKANIMNLRGEYVEAEY